MRSHSGQEGTQVPALKMNHVPDDGSENSSGENLGAKLLGFWAGGYLLSNVATTGEPEMIFEISDNALKGQAESKLKISGLTIKKSKLLISGRSTVCIVIRPTEAKYTTNFEFLAANLSRDFIGNGTLKGSQIEVESAILRWVDFLKRSTAVSQREAIQGLVGELLAMDIVLETQNLTFDAWLGPLAKPQDFRANEDWVEVKSTSSRKGLLTHKISSLDQLERPTSGNLYVISFRLSLSKSGAHSVLELVERVRKLPMFSGVDGQAHFSKCLQNAGFSSDLAEEFCKYDLFESRVFLVDDNFPRLTRESINADTRIFDISYSIDFSSIEPLSLDECGGKLALN